MAFGSKNSTPSFVLTLPLDISLNEQDYLYKEFKKCGVIYNQLVSVTTKMWHQLRKTRKYLELMAAIAKATPDSDEQKTLFKQREKMLKEYRFSEDAFHKLVVPYAKHYARKYKASLAGGWKFSSCKHWILNNNFLGARHSLIKELPRKR